MSALSTQTPLSSKLARMQVELDDRLISTRVLNDALYCHESPAATSRYIVEHEGRQERQMSSGVWVGPAAGSTAAIRSAGGKVLAVGSQKLQFVIREPYRGVDNKYDLIKGMVAPGEDIRITSRMTKGRLFLDGTQKVHAVGIGDRIRMTLAESGKPTVAQFGGVSVDSRNDKPYTHFRLRDALSGVARLSVAGKPCWKVAPYDLDDHVLVGQASRTKVVACYIPKGATRVTATVVDVAGNAATTTLTIR